MLVFGEGGGVSERGEIGGRGRGGILGQVIYFSTYQRRANVWYDVYLKQYQLDWKAKSEFLCPKTCNPPPAQPSIRVPTASKRDRSCQECNSHSRPYQGK